MKILSLTTIGLLLVAGFGCAYDGHYTFANTRKFLESDALGITKVAFAAPLAISDAVMTPATSYMDAPKYSRDKDHVYLSYVGMQTLIDSNMHGLCKFMAALMILPVDTAWFPVAGAVDTIYVINQPPAAKPEEEHAFTVGSASKGRSKPSKPRVSSEEDDDLEQLHELFQEDRR